MRDEYCVKTNVYLITEGSPPLIYTHQLFKIYERYCY